VAHTFTVTALNADGTVNTGYTGTVHFTSSNPRAVLPPDIQLTNSVGMFSAALDTVGLESLLATDTKSKKITATASISVS
jgi:hypothetical protein